MSKIRDIFSYYFEQAKTVYIVGPGPSIKENNFLSINKIPDHAITIALNSMVLYPKQFTYSMFFDLNLPHISWFKKTDFNKSIVLMGKDIEDQRAHFSFLYRPTVKLSKPILETKKILQGAATIAGCALQFAVKNLRCKEIILVGIDMRGMHHYDGTYANPEEDWHQAEKFQYLIDWAKGRGVKFSSLTPTRFNL